jgi:hypothetical protein
LDEKDCGRILSPYKKVLGWIEDTRTATNPHFEQVHNILYRAKMKFQQQRSRTAESGTETSNNMGRHSKMWKPRLHVFLRLTYSIKKILSVNKYEKSERKCCCTCKLALYAGSQFYYCLTSLFFWKRSFILSYINMILHLPSIKFYHL